MKSLRLLSWLAVAVGLAFLPACNRGPAKPKVAFVTNNPEEFWSIAEAGTKKGAAEFDVDVLFKRPSENDTGQQKEIIDALLAQNVKAIAISVIDPKNQRDYLNEIAARTKLLTQDNDAPDTKRLCYIGTDNYAAGKDVGRLVKKAMPEGGKLAIFVGSRSALNAQQRRQGVLDELAGMKDAKGPMYGNFELLDTYTDDANRQKCKENVATVLVKYQNEPNLCLVGLWAYNPPAILSAYEEKAKDIKAKVAIVGFDEDKDTLTGIADGKIFATVVQQPFLFGYDAVRIMAGLAKGDESVLPKGGVLNVPHKVVAKDKALASEFKPFQEVGEFRKELNEMLGKK